MTLVVNETVDAFGKPFVEIAHKNRKGMLTVYKPHEPGAFFKVGTTVGKLPKALEGSFTSMKLAKNAVFEYLRTAKPTAAKKRDDYYEERHPKE